MFSQRVTTKQVEQDSPAGLGSRLDLTANQDGDRLICDDRICNRVWCADLEALPSIESVHEERQWCLDLLSILFACSKSLAAVCLSCLEIPNRGDNAVADNSSLPIIDRG